MREDDILFKDRTYDRLEQLESDLELVKKELKLFQTIAEELILWHDGSFCGSLNNCTKCRLDQKSCLNKELLLSREVLKKLNSRKK
jgi:hypothetical protein